MIDIINRSLRIVRFMVKYNKDPNQNEWGNQTRSNLTGESKEGKLGCPNP